MPEPNALSTSARAAPQAARTLGLSWPLLVGLIAFLIPIGLRTFVLGDADTYWHVAAGRWMLEHGQVPSRDPFSHSMPGAPWSAHEWGAEILMALSFRLAGWAGMVLLTAAAFACTLAYLTRFLLRRMEPMYVLVVVSIVAKMMMPSLLARPHALVWPLTALWVGTLVTANEDRRAPPWWLLGLMVVWVNLHASFVMGLGLAAALAVDAILSARCGRRQIARSWGLFLAAASASVLLNPRGYHAVTYVIDAMHRKTALALITEWQSPDFQKPQVLLLWLLPMLLLAFAGRVRLPPVRSAMLVGLLLMALQHQRNVALLGLVSAFVMALPLASQWRALRDSGADNEVLDRWFGALAAPARLASVLLCLPLAVGAEALALGARQTQPRDSVTPQAALDTLLATGAAGRILNSYNFGGYLIYRGVPVFVDGRSDMYGDAFLTETEQALHVAPQGEDLDTLLSKYHIDSTLLAPDIPAIRLLDRSEEWQRIYADDVAVVHVRRSRIARRSGPETGSTYPSSQ